MRARTTAGSILLGVASIAVLTWMAPMLGRLDLVWRAVCLVPAIVILATVGYRTAAPFGSVPAYIGLFMLAVPPFVALGAIDIPLVGGVAEGPVETATGAWWATGFRLTDGIVRADLKSSVDIEVVTGSKPRRTAMITFQAVPVVSRDWTKAQPVRVWMFDYRKPPIDWSGVPAAGVRWRQDNDNDRAIAAIEMRTGLTSADGRILLMAAADPNDKVRSEMLWLGWIIGVASLVWAALVAVGAWLDRA